MIIISYYMYEYTYKFHIITNEFITTLYFSPKSYQLLSLKLIYAFEDIFAKLINVCKFLTSGNTISEFSSHSIIEEICLYCDINRNSFIESCLTGLTPVPF